MFHACRSVEQDNLILKERYVAEDCSKESILRAETSATRYPDAAHNKQPQVISNRNGEAVNNIAHIRVQGEKTARGNLLACTSLFPEIFCTL